MLQRAVLGERAFGMLLHAALVPEVEATLPEDPPAFVDVEAPTFWSRPRLLDRTRHYLAIMARAVHAASAPWPQALDAVASAGGDDDVSSLTVAFERTAGVVARTRATRVAVLIERQRRLTGALPASIAALDPARVAAIPGDPFSGAPLHYRRDAGGYTVYSVGANRKDDGGLNDDQSVAVCPGGAAGEPTVAAWRPAAR